MAALAYDGILSQLSTPKLTLNPTDIGGGILLPPDVLPYTAQRMVLSEPATRDICHALFIE